MADPARARKLADRIKVVVAETLERRIKDPRLGFVTITAARVTGDLQHATVFYTVFGDQTEKQDSASALASARGVLRAEVGRRTGVRLTPTLEFVEDAVPENAQAIEDLLRAAREQDAAVAGLAATAEYAGEADPYRAEPEDLDDEDDDDLEDDEVEDVAHDPDARPGPEHLGRPGDEVLDPDVRARRR